MIFGFNLLQWIVDRLTEAMQGLGGPIQPLVNLFSTTPLGFTTQNPIVQQAWVAVTAAADILLGLFIVIGVIQIMYGQSTGTLEMPIGQFIAKAVLTAILIHLSALLGEYLLTLNNLLCELVQGNIQDFIRQFNNGRLFTNAQTLILSIALTIVFGFTLFRIIFQTVKRLIRFNVLFVLSGPAFLSSFHPYTSSIFSIWARMYVSTIFEQFIQYLSFGLGLQFLIATKQQGLTGFVLAVALLSFTAEIPALLSRFSAAASSNGGGLGSLINTAMKVGILFA